MPKEPKKNLAVEKWELDVSATWEKLLKSKPLWDETPIPIKHELARGLAEFRRLENYITWEKKAIEEVDRLRGSAKGIPLSQQRRHRFEIEVDTLLERTTLVPVDSRTSERRYRSRIKAGARIAAHSRIAK